MGGVQSIVRAHLERDHRANVSSSLLAFFDPPGPSPLHPSVAGMGLTGRDSIRSARRKFRHLERSGRDTIPVWHDLWGLAFLGCYDRDPVRRLGAVHSQWPHLDYQLEGLRGGLDGVFTDSQAIADRVGSAWPDLDPARIRHLPVPADIAPPKFLEARPARPGKVLVLGYVGRVTLAQKRVDRLPALLDAVMRAGIPCRMEILGNGDALSTLPSRFPARAPVTFHGRKEGDEYWRIMSRWDFVLSTSDHEGSPLSLVEAMSLGNIPVFPRIGSGGDTLVSELDPALVYPPEDWGAVVRILKGRRKRSPETWRETRERCRQLSLRYSPDAYHSRFREFFSRILEMPRISREFAHRRPFHPADHLPFGILSRAFPRGYYRSNPLSD